MESKRQKTQHRKESDSLLEKEESPVPLETLLSLDVWKQLIFPFVGPNCFRFLGAVNKQFRSLYLEIHSNKTNYDQICTVKQAKLFYEDIQEGGLPIMLQKKCQLSSCKVMARLGRQEILEYFLAHDFAMDEKTCTAAAQGGHLKLLQWLRQQRCPCLCDELCILAAANGDIPMLQWLHEQGCVRNTRTCRAAAENGHLNVLQWLRMKKWPWNSWTCADATKNGHLHIIQWAHAEGCPWDSFTTRSAVMKGYVDILAFALDHDCPTDVANICFSAAEYGQLEILQYLHARGGFDLNKSVMSRAVEGNHFEIVKWLYSVNCPWDAYACSCAARKGNLEMLQWLRARDCPWDKNVHFFACLFNHEDILQWALNNGCPESDY